MINKFVRLPYADRRALMKSQNLDGPLKFLHRVRRVKNKVRMVKKRIQDIQRFYRLSPSGSITTKMQRLFDNRMCGTPDVIPSSNDLVEFGLAQKGLPGPGDRNRWPRNQKIKWFLETRRMPPPFKRRGEKKKGAKIERTKLKTLLRTAFCLWSKYAAIDFREIEKEKDQLSEHKGEDIYIRFGNRNSTSHSRTLQQSIAYSNDVDFDGVGGALAHAFPPPPENKDPDDKQTRVFGDIHLDWEENWSLATEGNIANIFAVFMHEIGHSLGLMHSNNQRSIMYGATGRSRMLTTPKLHDSDAAAIEILYGTRTEPLSDECRNLLSTDIEEILKHSRSERVKPSPKPSAIENRVKPVPKPSERIVDHGGKLTHDDKACDAECMFHKRYALFFVDHAQKCTTASDCRKRHNGRRHERARCRELVDELQRKTNICYYYKPKKNPSKRRKILKGTLGESGFNATDVIEMQLEY